MPKYAESPEWADVVPLPQDDGPNPLAAIAYTEEYSEAMAYLRAVMASNELTERVLELTEDVIDMNPAHYTVWLYRAQVLKTINADLRKEIEFINETALRHLKNYQIWHHRQMVVGELGSADGEREFIMSMFERDAKNYHVWSYRQWVVNKFGLRDQAELDCIDQMIARDVRNNSAWNHRWFVVFGGDPAAVTDQTIREREIEYAKAAIRRAPQNQSPWNYLRGILRQAKLPKSHVKPFVTDFASLDRPDEILSTHALDLLADIYAEEEGKQEDAATALELLERKYDPVRANYWRYRKGLLEGVAA